MEKTRAEYGTAILMEVETGDIKAIANFGVNSKGQLVGGYQNYAIGNAGCSEPGSTFKLASLMAAFEDGKVDTSTIVDTGNGIWKYKRVEIKDSDYKKGGHGKITAKHAFELSSNIGLAKLITGAYGKNEQDFIDRVNKLGMFEKLDLGIQGEAVPYYNQPDSKTWSGISLAWMSFGYELKVTPLQTLTFYNAVANGGTMMKPRLVKGITENGSVREKIGTESLKWSVCSAKTLRKVKAMLEGVISNGTGKLLETKAYKIAGKSGTALVANNKEGYIKGGQKIYQSSFVGYFPAEDPKYSCIVVINAPKGADIYGSSVAGPVFRQISDYVYAYELGLNEDVELPVAKIENDIPGTTAGRKKDIANVLDELDILNGFTFTKSEWVEASPDEDGLELSNREVRKGLVPNVRGMGATDAVYLLENNGLRVSVRGRGKVKSQSVRAGTKIQRGQSIVLVLS
jgi:cell division protein FtsI (penicillin-binding protein 3)